MPVARDRGDDPIRADAADAVVDSVRDVEAAVRADSDTTAIGQHCLGGRAAVAAEA